MSAKVFEDLYERLFQVIKADTAIVPALVPQANVFPEDDPGEPIAGTQIVYTWLSSGWSKKNRRGEGVLRLQVLSVDNKIQAHSVLALLRDLLVPKNLSGTVASGARELKVPLFTELPVATDTEQDETMRWSVETQFSVKLVGWDL